MRSSLNELGAIVSLSLSIYLHTRTSRIVQYKWSMGTPPPLAIIFH